MIERLQLFFCLIYYTIDGKLLDRLRVHAKYTLIGMMHAQKGSNDALSDDG